MTKTTNPGAGIRLLREEAGLTVNELASRMGASASYVSRVERGTARASNVWLSNAASAIAAHLAGTDLVEAVA